MYHLVDAYAIYAITAVGGTHVLLPGWDVREALELLARRRVTATHVAATQVCGTAQEMVPVVVSAAPVAVVAAPQVRPVMS